MTPIEKDTERLVSSGWKMIGTQPGKYQRTECWDHPDYNSGRRGWLTRGAALRIQKKVDADWIMRNGSQGGKVRHG